MLEALMRRGGRAMSTVLAAVLASILFGVYHFAHSAPFNTVHMVLLLSAVGLVTSAFFFISRDIAGTSAADPGEAN
jgi:membrane protease YdiL (CAAX protease family)